MKYLVAAGLSSLEITEFAVTALFAGMGNNCCRSIRYEHWRAIVNLSILDRCLKDAFFLRIPQQHFHRLDDSGQDVNMQGTLVLHGNIMTFHASFMHHN
ncbi:hypothetical protein B0H13DRAFT_2342840 [Mycena leptocephala]|nr:hypothetical protein B0H13DRAFT_2342840 [Mycena leptocephala]